MAQNNLIHTTQEGFEIYVSPGRKVQSPFDFRVRFKQPGKPRLRTPSHVHLIVELYVKQAYNKPLADSLVSDLLRLFQQLAPINVYPPNFQKFVPGNAAPYAALNRVGEFSVEFILAVNELIFIQEKTNYPMGSLTQKLYQDFLTKNDRFSVLAQAAFSGRR